MMNNIEIQYPSLLIITRRNILIDTDSTSVTIRSFLGSWPEDKLSLICCEDFNAGENGRISNNCFKLTNDNVLLGSFLFKTNNRPSSSAVGSPVSKKSNNPIKSFKQWIRHLAYSVYTCLPYKKTNEIDTFIRERRPEIIYTNFTNLRMLRLVNNISKRFKLTVMPHFFDDWPNIYLVKGEIGHHLFKRELKQLFKGNPSALCISPKMCEEYKRRYHLKSTYPLLNSVEPKGMHVKKEKIDDSFVLFFAGSLYLGRHETLLSLCEEIKDRMGIRIQICAPETQWEQFSSLFEPFGFVEYCGFLSSDQLLAKIDQADCLLFVESFDESYLKYTSLSLSTRVPEYLSTGVPILALGNEQQGSLEYLSENKAAYVAFCKNDISSIFVDCYNHVSDVSILESAEILFNKNHLRYKQEERFRDLIKAQVV